ncbi:hypothetical protein NQ317_002183 [Molorchus minor]|uniref:E3 ubiquitin-protein ligase n=1 Tax=Molorchus minor TaxID=1323400 RepID=A0ABQ9J029_9CUCU|nr:hypothetical protein NQ317_002183 [Molorchus minor]
MADDFEKEFLRETSVSARFLARLSTSTVSGPSHWQSKPTDVGHVEYHLACLCTESFKKGNHAKHDFNMFLSQAGGACDCGDTSVMGYKEEWRKKGGDKEKPISCSPDAYKGGAIQDADAFIMMLLDFNNMGGVMRKVMISGPYKSTGRSCEELVFWTVKFEVPQKVVCLLLNMLPDPDYKEAD